MRITCPYCGERDLREFTYRGAAGPSRPDAGGADAASAFADYVYVRENPAGPLSELWYHRAGCRSWLVVERDTRTHDIGRVVLAAEQDAD